MGSTINIKSGDDSIQVANLQRSMLELARIGSLAAGDMADGTFDDYQSSAGIDSGLSTNYTYDGTGKKVTPFEGSTGNTGTEDITDVGVASGTALIQDIKASITTWTKDASTTGHFNTANAAVTTGCLITFADASTATIIAKTGDGTGANNITLSVDHATDAALASILGLVYSAPNVTLNSAYGATTQTWAHAAASSAAINANQSYRQIHAAANISTSGNRVRVTLQGASGGTCVLSHVAFAEVGSVPSAAGAFGGSQYKELLFSGASGCTVAQSGTTVSDWLVFNVDETKAYMTICLCGSNSSFAYTDGGGDNSYYKADGSSDWNTQNVSGYTLQSARTAISIKLEVASLLIPAALFAVHTNTADLDTSLWSAISDVTATQATAGSSTVYHAASFNKGNAAEKWYVYLSSAWHTIVELTSGTWQYRDAGAALQNATINSRLGALAQAFGITENKMSATALTGITQAQWATPFVAGTLDFAAGLTANAANIPTLDKWTVTYNLAPQNMTLISQATTGLITPQVAQISLLVKGYTAGDTMKAYFSSATSPSWTELTGLTAVASNVGASGVSQFTTGQIAVTGSADKSIRTKVEMNAGQSLELHAQSVVYR